MLHYGEAVSSLMCCKIQGEKGLVIQRSVMCFLSDVFDTTYCLCTEVFFRSDSKFQIETPKLDETLGTLTQC
uniref:Uncharacterized protein n=1 Tax=Arundo donax TaxID=35708 RepID=A0A0A9A1T6_ARUDO